MLEIESAEDAWSWLEAALKDKPIPEALDLSFKSWPSISFNVKGRDWKSSVPTRIMMPLIDYQRDLLRAYATVRYGSPNTHKLRDDERDQLELVVEVADGSSEFKAELDKQFTALAQQAIDKMTSRHLLILILGIAVAYSATEIGKQYFETQQKLADVQKTVQLSEQDTKRLEIFAKALEQSQVVSDTKIDRLETENKILKAMKPDDVITTGDVVLNGAQAQAITRPEKATSEALMLSGIYRILRNDTDKSDGFRIKIEEISSGETLSVDVPAALPFAQRELISAAEWKKTPIALNIDAEKFRDVIRKATVTSAAIPPDAKQLVAE